MAEKVITGTRQAKASRGIKVHVKKSQHKAGPGKMRCPKRLGCGIGMAVLVQDSTGRWIYRCERCQREFHAEQRM